MSLFHIQREAVANQTTQGKDIVFHLANVHGGRGFIETHPGELVQNFMIDGKDIVLTYNEGKKKPERFPIEHGEDNVEYWRKLLACCRKRDPKTLSPADLAYHVQTALIMASLAQRQGKVARFDAKAEKIVL